METETETQHADYPHEPGRLYTCEACESQCYCSPDLDEEMCVYCYDQGMNS